MKTPASVDPVLPDTSVWIDYFRGDEGVIVELNALMEAGRVRVLPLILGELLRGVSRDAETRVVRDLGVTFPVVPEPPEAWVRAGLMCGLLRSKGFHPGLADAYIALCASECGVTLWTHDRHFQQIRDRGGLRLILK